MNRLTPSFVAALALTPAGLAAQGEAPRHVEVGPAERVRWDRFHDYDDLLQLAHRLRERWPRYVKIEEIGRSYQGRPMVALTVNDPETGPPERKPAMYVDGNIHGNEVQGAEAALYTVWYLLSEKDRAPKLKEILARAVLYVVPSVNPDGRAYWFEHPNTMHSSRGGQIPTDEDGDGRYDEDGPNDLDGDGNICRMRKKVPGRGDWKLDPNDPRVMVRCKPGEKGDYVLLGQEGIDDDGDGRVNEDGPGGYDPNRDFGSDWQPASLQYGARPLPFDLPETRAIRDFIAAHPNIAGVQSFHNFGGMILRGPGDKHVSYPRPDQAVYDALGRKGEKLLPYYRYMIVWKDLYRVHGSEVDWTYLGLGILSFTNELWTRKRWFRDGREPPEPERLELQERLDFGAHFVPWKEYDHPTYGKIEIGGPTKDTGRIPPAFLIREMLHRNAAFVLYHMSELPEIEVESTKVEPAGGGLFYVTISFHNERLIPTRTAQVAQHRIGRPDLVEVSADGCRLLAAGRVLDPYRPFRTALPGTPKPEPGRVVLEDGIGSHGTLRLRWLVEGTGRLRVRYTSEKARDLAFQVRIGHR